MFISARYEQKYKQKKPLFIKQGRKITWYHSASRESHDARLIDFAAKEPEKSERCNGRTRCAYYQFNTLLTE